jgi:hypothetical protein
MYIYIFLYIYLGLLRILKKFLYIVILHSKCTRALTFENVHLTCT